MAGKCRPSLREKTLEIVKHSNLSQTNKDCIAEVFKRYEEAQVTIERWQEECGKQSVLWSKHYESIFESAKEVVRAEAITEFAERLKKYYNRLDNSQGNLISFHIDQIAKEMKEGVNNA